MNKRLFFIAALLIGTACVSTFMYAQNSYSQNPANPYVSQPGYAGGYNSSQLQGQVPYRPTSNANSSSSGLSSFMRNFSGTDTLSRYLGSNSSSNSTNNYQTYSQPSQTVTSMQQERITSPAYTAPMYHSGIPDGTNLQSNFNQPALSNQQYNPQTAQMRSQPDNSYSFSQPGTQAGTNSEDISRSLADIKEQLNMLQQKLETGNYSSNTSLSNNIQKYTSSSGGTNVASTSELYSGIDENPAQRYLSKSGLNSYQSGISSSSARMEQQTYDDSLDQIKRKLDDLSRSIDTRSQKPRDNSTQYKPISASPAVEDQPANFQSYSQSQFDKYFNVGQDQLRHGNYLDAADSFTLASIYQPENPYCYAGQGHAMFAAGQYVNSALFIIRAIELNPNYIQTPNDLVTITGGGSIIAARTAELEQLLKKAPAAGLQFLLAYAYYQTGRLTDARQLINAVYQEMSQSRAALALKIAVDNKLNSQRQ